jgi:uncharacterized protein involved in exopolysaccharide biosynthesis
MDLSFSQLVGLLRSRWKVVVGVPFVLALLTATVLLVQSRTYSSGASFVPRASESARGSLSAITSQLGLAVSAGTGQSPDFYADLVRLRPVVESVVAQSYALTDGGPKNSLTTLFKIRAKTPEQRLDLTVRQLQNHIVVTKNPRTGVVSFGVSVKSPWLAATLSRALLAATDKYDQDLRQQRAVAEQHFMDERLGELRDQLHQAEVRVADFHKTNRSYEASPDLEMELQQLNRDVSARLQLLATVSQLYEQARLDALRNTPSITVMAWPEVPAWPDPRRIALKTLLAGLISGIMVVGILVLLEMRPWQASELRR